MVQADERRLQQLFENLMRNAVEHGNVDVTVRVGDLPEGFSIEDDGPGIPADLHDEIFEAGSPTRIEGTEYGLTIVTGVVEAHGWSVRVTEGASSGARFEITGVRSG